MHTLMVIVGGLILLGICLVAGRAINQDSGIAAGALAFLPLWLAATAFNMWYGVSRAGYSVTDEFPIFAALFGFLAVVALLVWWRVR